MITNKIEARDNVKVKGNLNVDKDLQVEGKVELGNDLEVDGKVTLNSSDDLVTKDGSTFGEENFITDCNQEPTSQTSLIGTLSTKDGQSRLLSAKIALNGIATFNQWQSSGTLIATFTTTEGTEYNVYAPQYSSVNKYFHNARISDGNREVSITIVNDTSDKLTFTSVCQWLYDNKNTNTGIGAYPASGGYGTTKVYIAISTNDNHNALFFIPTAGNSDSLTDANVYDFVTQIV